MAKAPKWGVNTYIKSTKKSVGRHKKNMNKQEKKKLQKISWTG